MTDKIIYFKPEERTIVDTHLLAMATCIWPTCTEYKAEDFQLCIQHIRSATVFSRQGASRPDIPDEVKQRMRAKEEAELERYKNGEPLQQPPGFIYVLRSDEMIKIGYTQTLKIRLRQYPPGAKVLVTFPGSTLIEKHIHSEFRHLIVKGREWFKEVDELVAWIQKKQRIYGDVPTALNEGRFRDGQHVSISPRTNSRSIRSKKSDGSELRRRFSKYNHGLE